MKFDILIVLCEGVEYVMYAYHIVCTCTNVYPISCVNVKCKAAGASLSNKYRNNNIYMAG